VILITGINGFIGSHLARLLLQKGHKVAGLIRKTGNLSNLCDIKSMIELIEGNILDKASLERAFKDINVCFHLAALVKYGNFSPNEYFANNLQGTINVCEAALNARVERFIYTSSCETLRPSPKRVGVGGFINESMQNFYTSMIGDYGRSKFLAEEHVKSQVSLGLNAIILNPTAVYGPGDINITSPKKLLLSYLEGKIPVYFETGFNAVDVRDVAKALVLAFEKGHIGERYVVGSTNTYLTDFFGILKNASGKKPFSLRVPYRLLSTLATIAPISKDSKQMVRASRYPFFFDSHKLKKELGWSPQFDLKSTIKDAL